MPTTQTTHKRPKHKDRRTNDPGLISFHVPKHKGRRTNEECTQDLLEEATRLGAEVDLDSRQIRTRASTQVLVAAAAAAPPLSDSSTEEDESCITSDDDPSHEQTDDHTDVDVATRDDDDDGDDDGGRDETIPPATHSSTPVNTDEENVSNVVPTSTTERPQDADTPPTFLERFGFPLVSLNRVMKDPRKLRFLIYVDGSAVSDTHHAASAVVVRHVPSNQCFVHATSSPMSTNEAGEWMGAPVLKLLGSYYPTELRKQTRFWF